VEGSAEDRCCVQGYGYGAPDRRNRESDGSDGDWALRSSPTLAARLSAAEAELEPSDGSGAKTDPKIESARYLVSPIFSIAPAIRIVGDAA
jgi:hypothetical protein